MQVDSLGTPAQVWRRWVAMAAGHAAAADAIDTGSPQFEIRRRDGCGDLSADHGWFRVRRLGGNRMVLWGHHDELPVDERFREDLLDLAPDWAYDEDSAHAHRDVGLLAWYAHGSWSSVPGNLPDAVARELAPLTHDDLVHEWWSKQWPHASAEQVEEALSDLEPTALAAVVGAPAAARAGRQARLGRTWSGHQLSDAATAHLREAVHSQMKASPELEPRHFPMRPTLLRQWSRVHVTGVPFRYALCAIGTAAVPDLVPCANNSPLPEPARRSLDNVLMELRMSETGEESGAWLFAQVESDGRSIRLERRFDGWPEWYHPSDQGPTMSALYAEMTHRAPRWRPGWAALLPERSPLGEG